MDKRELYNNYGIDKTPLDLNEDYSVNQYAEFIMSKHHGRDVRGSLSFSLKKMDEVIAEATNRQTDVESQLQEVIDNTTDKDVISAPEIIAARDGEANLKTRLDKEHREVTAQLAETEQQMNRELIGKKTRRPMMTFIDDDGREQFPSKWESIIKDKNIPVTVCLVTSFVGTINYMDWDTIHRMKKLGVEFISHTHTHPLLTEITEEEVRYEFETSQRILREQGLQPNALVYPGGSDNAFVRQITREYFRTGIAIGNRVNYPPLRTYRLYRFPLASDYNNTLDIYKSRIDEAIENNGWVVWMSHSQYPSFTEEQEQNIRELIDYARSKGMDIVNVNDGLDAFGNVLDVGDYPDANAEFTIIDADGIMHSKSNANKFLTEIGDNEVKIDTSHEHFPMNTITRTAVTNANRTGFPENSYGTLETSKIQIYGYYFQIFYPANSNNVYRRYWNTPESQWSEFEKISLTVNEIEDMKNHVVGSVNEYTSSTPISDFPREKIISFPVSETAASNVPNERAGVITNYRFTSDSYAWQEFKPYGRNEKWMRYVSGGNWTDWVKVTS